MAPCGTSERRHGARRSRLHKLIIRTYGAPLPGAIFTKTHYSGSCWHNTSRSIPDIKAGLLTIPQAVDKLRAQDELKRKQEVAATDPTPGRKPSGGAPGISLKGKGGDRNVNAP